jgi:hypothetical protein
MATLRNLDPVCDECIVRSRICISGNYSQRLFTELHDYWFRVLAILTIQTDAFQGR